MYLVEKENLDEEVLLPSESILNRHNASKLSPFRYILILGLLCLAIVAYVVSFVTLERRTQKPFDIPQLPEQESCDHATARPSWHSLPLHRRHGYVRAVDRLTSLPSRLGLNTSLYDDFTYIHIQLVWQTHHAAISLPYHRYFLTIFEKVLRDQGGYDQPLPFWDWTLDADRPFASPVWSKFGGFGPAIEGCISGKSANYSERGYDRHCVKRTFNSNADDGIMHSNRWSKVVVDEIVETSDSYDELRNKLESGPHKHLHLGVGGEMLTASSTNDPLFFLHHAQIDRLWWLWQQKDPERRNFDFSGTVISSDGDREDVKANLMDNIRMLSFAEDVIVRDVMRTDSALLCYKYKNEL